MKTRLCAFPFASSLFLLPRFLAFAVATALLFVTTGAHAQMSETEKKAAARAAYQEGVKLQDDGKYADALARFESAEKLFDAPTHLLHIAECQALTGRLVESSETYETLARKTLPAGSPDAFTQAQQQGQAELPALRARIPSLRVTMKPGPQQVQNLQVNVNGVNMPNELLGIARPLNPGTYRFSAQAVGWSTVGAHRRAPRREGAEERRAHARAGAGWRRGRRRVRRPPPPTAPADRPTRTAGEAALVRRADARRACCSASTAARSFPAARSSNNVRGSTTSRRAGGGGGLDVYVRLAKMLLLGATFEYASLGAPKSVDGVTGTFDASRAHDATCGVNLGIIPNVDKVSFIGDLGLGSRSATQKLTRGAGSRPSPRSSGLEFALERRHLDPGRPDPARPEAGDSASARSAQRARRTAISSRHPRHRRRTRSCSSASPRSTASISERSPSPSDGAPCADLARPARRWWVNGDKEVQRITSR